MKNIKLFVTFVASLFFLFSCEKEKVETCGFDTIRLTESFLTEYAKGRRSGQLYDSSCKWSDSLRSNKSAMAY